MTTTELPLHAYEDNPFTNAAKTCRRYSVTDAPVIRITRGETGFTPIFTDLSAHALNAQLSVTAEQAAAMLHGSLFGFDTPGANPSYWASLFARVQADSVLKGATTVAAAKRPK